MKENRETEFAMVLGQIIGYLAAPDIKEYLMKEGVLNSQIELARKYLKIIASQAFYGE